MKELIVPARIEFMDKVLTFVNSELKNFHCPMKTQTQINIAVDEIFTNIASYAYRPVDGDVVISVDVEGDPPHAKIRFADRGKPYDPLKKRDPDVTLSADERDIGGLGIFIVKKSMTSMKYHYEDDQNILTIEKNLY